MSRPPLHRRMSLFGANGRRMIAVLMVVAVGALLAVPATAGAHVNRHHKAELKKSLSVYSLAMKHWQQDANGCMAMLNDMDNQMTQLLSADPKDLEALQAIEETAGRLHDEWNVLWKSSKPRMDKAIDGFYSRSRPWFKTKADRSRLHTGTRALKAGFDMLLSDGWDNLALAALALHDENLTECGHKTFQAGADLMDAQNRFDTGMGDLKKLL
ncbi:MAG TPA: hypothetical protein VIK32_04830 [Candidatus Limnocylindrales bacterium]